MTHCAFSLFDWSFFQIKRGPIGRLASASGFAITCANDHHTSGHDAAVSFYTERTASVYSHQADEVRASKLIGTKVINTANETIGDVNEVILGKDGKVAAVIVGVGGFLGEREVALTFDSLRMTRDSGNNLVLSVNATKDGLKAAPEWRSDAMNK